jgi:RND family efflux transporter MFP subunit
MDKCFWLCMLCSLNLLAASCAKTLKSETKPTDYAAASSKNADQPVTVAVTKAALANLSQKLTLAAEFRPSQETDLHAKVAGYLQEINVDVGDHVRQGQIIASLEVPEFKDDLQQATFAKKRSESDVLRARSESQRANSVYDAANLTYNRLWAVSQARPNLIAQQEIDEALAKVQIAQAQVNTAKASLEVAEDQVKMQEAMIERVNTIAAYTTIRAPFSGVITNRYADKGAMIQQGTASQTQALPVVRLSQISRLRLVLPVPESVVPRIRIGRAVQVNVPALNQTFTGRVARFAETVTAATRTMETEVDVPNPRLLLKPGMYATADLELDKKSDTITVPVQTISRKENKTIVMVVNAQKKLEVREIVTGLETPISVEVVAGLREGEMVVVGNLSQFKAGQTVEPKETVIGEVKGGN